MGHKALEAQPLSTKIMLVQSLQLHMGLVSSSMPACFPNGNNVKIACKSFESVHSPIERGE